MSINQEVDLLRRIPLFAKIDPARLRLLAFASERISFAAGDELFHQGDPADAAYIIMDGNVDISIDVPNGQLALAKVGRDQIVGEIGIICDVPRTATVTAKSQLTTLRIDKDLFYRLINEFPQMAVEIMRELARRLDKTNEQLRAAVTRAGAA